MGGGGEICVIPLTRRICWDARCLCGSYNCVQFYSHTGLQHAHTCKKNYPFLVPRIFVNILVRGGFCRFKMGIPVALVSKFLRG